MAPRAGTPTGSGPHGDIVAYAARACEHRYGFTGALDHLHEQLAAGHAALLLDGLDEVLGGDSAEDAERAYRLVAGEVDRLSARFRAAPIAVTCRRAGWQGGLRAFQTLDVLDFAWPQIETFIGNWFGTDQVRADGLKSALQANIRIQSLAANPLILSLIAIVYERDLELPERRAELYNRCVEVLLKEWDSHRGIRRASQFTTDRKRDLLEEIAWHFHSRGLRYYPKDELLGIIGEFLPTIDVPALDYGYAASLGRAVAALGGSEGADHIARLAEGTDSFIAETLIDALALSHDHSTGRRLMQRISTAQRDLVNALVRATLGILGPESAPEILV